MYFSKYFNSKTLIYRYMKIFEKITIIVMTILSLTITTSCNNNTKNTDYSKFSLYINSFTDGIISESETIKIRLNTQIQNWENKEIEDIFSFSPNIKGEAKWIASDMIEFIPENYPLGNITKHHSISTRLLI